jgi:hypothetical protein
MKVLNYIYGPKSHLLVKLCGHASVFHIEFEIKDTTDAARSALYLGLHINIDSECPLI